VNGDDHQSGRLARAMWSERACESGAKNAGSSMWPIPSIVSSVACGMASAVSWPVGGGKIGSSDGLRFAATVPLGQVEHCDVLFVAGGMGAAAACVDEELIAELQRLAATADYVTSVCTGSLVLGAAGLLVGRRAASHWAWRDLLTKFGAVPDDRRVVRDANIITGGGVTAGIDFALTIAAELVDDTTAQGIQLGIEYAPAPPFSAGRPQTAPTEVRIAAEQRNADFRAARMHDIDTAAQRLSHN
jgi:cyclohexyl-isocyanide hydratase